MCDKCKKTTSCSCEEVEVCGCKATYELICSVYTGPDLEPLNIKKGMNGDVVIKKINDYIAEITPESPDPATLVSYGVVGQSENVTNITTQNATDLASAIALINELKAKLNAKLNADRESGQQNND